MHRRSGLPLSYWPRLLNEIPLARYSFVLFFTALTWFGARSTNGYTDGPILCPFKLATGHPCPFCGTTRSFGALVQGDFFGSLAYNPSGLLLSTGLLFWVVSPERFRALRNRVSNIGRRLTSPTKWMLFALLLVLAWGYALARW